jgi:uncharacterized OsmC-like protein
MSVTDSRVVQPRHVAAPVFLMQVVAVAGERTVADGALWDGALNATPDDNTDGPSLIESLMAALAGCLARNLRSVADEARVVLDRIEMAIAATRSDDPPAITGLVVDLAIDSPAAADRVRHVVDLAIRYGTIARTLARACPLTINLTINRGDPEELPRVA